MEALTTLSEHSTTPPLLAVLYQLHKINMAGEASAK